MHSLRQAGLETRLGLNSTAARVHTHTLYEVIDPGIKGLPDAINACNAHTEPVMDGSWSIIDAVKPTDDGKAKKADEKKPSEKADDNKQPH